MIFRMQSKEKQEGMVRMQAQVKSKENKEGVVRIETYIRGERRIIFIIKSSRGDEDEMVRVKHILEEMKR